MYTVYIIESIKNPQINYVGFTTDIKRRIKKHNQSGSKHTNKFKPWKLKTCTHFSNKKKALAFERYLKTPSGKAFTNKRLI